MKLVNSKKPKGLIVFGKPYKKENNVKITGLNEEEILNSAENINVFDILEKSVEMQKYCEDSVVDVNSCSVRFGEESGKEYLLFFDDGSSKWRVFFTKHSISQLGFRYGLSTSYIQRCTLANLKGLVCENFNQWFNVDIGKLLIRKYDTGEDEFCKYARGILSTRYKKYDTNEIMTDITNSDINTWEVKQYLLSPERFHLRLVSNEKLDVPGDDLFIGINVDSSDVGRSSINLQLIIFRQVCSNGLILPYSVGNFYRQVHLGEGAEKFPDRIAAKLDEVVAIKNEAERMINNTMGKDLPFDIKNEDEVLKFRQSTGITKFFMDKVIEMYENRGYKNNERWDLINCMTEVAQGFDIDLRLQFERAAGSLLIVA